MSLTIKWQDVSGLQRLANALGVLESHQKHLALQRAVNHTGAKARTQVVRALAKQTGLPNKLIAKAVRVKKAWGASTTSFVPGRGSLDYVMSATGGDISLKYFKARETRRGVTASPFGKRQLFEGTFMKGGGFPNRVNAPRLGGHVFKRVGSTRGPIELQDSGVIIPAEMMTGPTADAFTKVVNRDLAARVSHEINRLCPGIFS